MILPAIATLLFILALYYMLFLLVVQSGLRNLDIHHTPLEQPPFVSVIVSARNEELSIEECIHRILNQDYPQNQFELIVVNDRSSDRTASILGQISNSQSRLRILTTSGDQNLDAVGKPAAISLGVMAAKGEVILTTDADCFVPETWVKTMVQHMGPEVAFAAGPVHELPSTTLLSELSSLEYLGLITTAAGLIGAQRPIICSGANLGYRKKAFLEVQGYGKRGAWCDDETLMHRIRDRKLGAIVFVSSAKALVQTASADSWTSFWKQRLRWSAKESHFESLPIMMSLIALYFFFLFLLMVFFASLFDFRLRIWFIIPFALKLVVDYSTLVKGAKLFGDRISLLVFFIAEVFHVPYVVFTAGIGQFISLQWKGRRIT